MKTAYWIEGVRCSADTMPWSSANAYLVTRIEVGAEHRGQGYGSALLRMLCADADEEAATLVLSVSGDGSAGAMSNHDLTRWYERYGFEDRGVAMVRDPRIPQAGEQLGERSVARRNVG